MRGAFVASAHQFFSPHVLKRKMATRAAAERNKNESKRKSGVVDTRGYVGKTFKMLTPGNTMDSPAEMRECVVVRASSPAFYHVMVSGGDSRPGNQVRMKWTTVKRYISAVQDAAAVSRTSTPNSTSQNKNPNISAKSTSKDRINPAIPSNASTGPETAEKCQISNDESGKIELDEPSSAGKSAVRESADAAPAPASAQQNPKRRLSIKELKGLLREASVDTSRCITKSDLVALAQAHNLIEVPEYHNRGPLPPSKAPPPPPPHQQQQQQRQQQQQSGSSGRQSRPADAQQGDLEEDPEAEDEEFCTVEWDSDPYLKNAKRHPDPAIEAAALNAVRAPSLTESTRNIDVRIMSHGNIVSSGLLSSLQLESVVRATVRHQQLDMAGRRLGFFIGDGAGVGKGRQIAGIILENWLRGHKRHVWISASADLEKDSERDLVDLGASDIPVKNLRDYAPKANVGREFSSGVLFLTFSLLIRRLDQLILWCGDDFEGCIVFDECHKAKNLVRAMNSNGKTVSKNEKPTKTGLAVQSIQDKLPLARVVYASATGISEPRHLGYMTRLGLWGEGTGYENFVELWKTVQGSSTGAFELVALHMKMEGMYLCRQLSFEGATFEIIEANLEGEGLAIYNSACKFWQKLLVKLNAAWEELEPYEKYLGDQHYVSAAMVGGVDADMIEDAGIEAVFREFADGYESDGDGDMDENARMTSRRKPGDKLTMRRFAKALYWGAHQRFFKSLLMSLKVHRVIELSREALAKGNCVVVGLQSTGEARSKAMAVSSGGTLDALPVVSRATARAVIKMAYPQPKPPRAYVEDLVRNATRIDVGEASSREESEGEDAHPRRSCRRQTAAASKISGSTYALDDDLFGIEDDEFDGGGGPADGGTLFRKHKAIEEEILDELNLLELPLLPSILSSTNWAAPTR